MPLLKWIGPGSFWSLQFWALISIVSILLALEAYDLRHISLAIGVGTLLSIVPIVVDMTMTVVMAIVMSTRVVAPESTIGPVTIKVVATAFVEVVPMDRRIEVSSTHR